jgi:hypothetical protein
MSAAGFLMVVRETPDIGQVKVHLGMPMDLASWHPAEVGRYFIKGTGLRTPSNACSLRSPR